MVRSHHRIYYCCRLCYSSNTAIVVTVIHNDLLLSTILLQDLGCGVGGPANRIGKAFPGCEVVGLNICEYQLKKARSYAERDGLDKVSFIKVY